jgi:hypothetical protein
VVAIAAATSVLSLAFALNGVNSNPLPADHGSNEWARRRGPEREHDPYTGVTSPADLAALVALNQAKGVVAHSGPYPIVGDTGPAGAEMRSTDIDTSVEVEGREPRRGRGRPTRGDRRDVAPTRGRGQSSAPLPRRRTCVSARRSR